MLEQQQNIEKQLKKGPLWKCVVYGLMCLKQEFEVYKYIAADHSYDMTKFLEKTIDRFWKAAASGYRIDEKYLLAVEESVFEPKDEYDEVALKIVKDIYDFFYAVSNKEKVNTIAMQKHQIDLIKLYLKIIGEEFTEENYLIEKTLEFQKMVFMDLDVIKAKDKKNFIKEYENKDIVPIMKRELFDERPFFKKEKPLKKKLPEIRFMSLNFERERKNITEEEYACIEEKQNKRLMEITYWLRNWNEFLKTPEKPVNQRDFIDNRRGNSEPDYIDFYYYLETCYVLQAESVYVHTLNEESVLGYWYLSACANLKVHDLIKEGAYRSSYMQYYIDKNISVIGAMIQAVAVDDEELLKNLWEYAINTSEKQEAQIIIAAAENRDEDAAKMLEQIEEKTVYDELIDLIVKKDEKSLRKAILREIKADRKSYEMYRTMVDPTLYGAMRLAKKHGMIIEIHAAEVLNGNLDAKISDKSKWTLPK